MRSVRGTAVLAVVAVVVLVHPALGRAGEERPGIRIIATSTPAPGTQMCVTVVPTGNEKGVGVSVELNDVPLAFTTTSSPEGTLTVCFHVPAGGAGGTLTITATAGGAHTTLSLPVGSSLPTPPGGG